MSVSVSVEWGQMVLLGSDASVVRRAVKHLESIRLGMLVAPLRADGSLTARTERADWSLSQVLRIFGSLRAAQFDVVLRAGVVSAPFEHRQGGPAAAREVLPVQRTLLRVDNPAESLLPYSVERAADRFAVAIVDGPTVLTSDPATHTSLAMVEYDIDAQPEAAERWYRQEVEEPPLVEESGLPAAA